ncbi:MAG TPA: hypothetical protein VJR89_07960 [Polyangiales bacterium]|nr:hypothetical protein [Polyangiales bacterium]
MIRKVCIGVSIAAVALAAALWAPEDASANTVYGYDYSPRNGSGTYFTHPGPPNVAGTVYAGNNVSGQVTRTSFILSGTAYNSYYISVTNYCTIGSGSGAGRRVSTLYEAVTTSPCSNSSAVVSYARGGLSE